MRFVGPWPAAAAAAMAVLALVAAPARGQAPAPSLQVTAADLRQAGDELRFGLRFNRAVPVRQLDPRHGRVVCVVLSPSRPSRRRACVSRRGGRLRATIGRIDARGTAAGATRAVRGARILVSGGYLSLRAPAGALHVRLGGRVHWRAQLRWRDGTGCAAPGAGAGCTQVVPESGTLTLATRAPRRPAFTRLHRLRLLATGDSMIQYVDIHLARRLQRRRGASVRSDAHVGTGISKPAQLDWVRKARGQASRFRPDATVVYLGANEGFPLTSPSGARADCCDVAWTAAYARRVEAMMRSYRRGGRSYVYWLTLPAPRAQSHARVYRAVNTAIRHAAARAGDGVRVVDLARVFTPGWRFRQTITFRGRRISARQADGIHLTSAGAAVAATLVVDRLAADRALP